MPVQIERSDNKIIITLPDSIEPAYLQQGISYFKFIDIVGESKATDQDIKKLSKSVKAAMAKPIIDRLKELDEFKDL
jgi:hypothetical protein